MNSLRPEKQLRHAMLRLAGDDVVGVLGGGRSQLPSLTSIRKRLLEQHAVAGIASQGIAIEFGGTGIVVLAAGEAAGEIAADQRVHRCSSRSTRVPLRRRLRGRLGRIGPADAELQAAHAASKERSEGEVPAKTCSHSTRPFATRAKPILEYARRIAIKAATWRHFMPASPEVFFAAHGGWRPRNPVGTWLECQRMTPVYPRSQPCAPDLGRTILVKSGALSRVGDMIPRSSA